MESIFHIKTILNKIYIHPFTYILIFLSGITGMIKEFCFILLIIFIHELGHLFGSFVYKWNFNKIAIYPFGGCCKFDEKINRPIKEELFILIMGPFFQIVLYFIMILFSKYGLISYRNILIFKNYHYTLLFFNLLPIYPLDGGRILNNLISYILPYKKANRVVIVLSFILITILIIYYKNLNFILMGILLIFEIILYLKRQNFLYNKMLLERFITPFYFKKTKIIKDKDSIYKDKKHVILYKNKYITEKDYLKERYKVIS